MTPEDASLLLDTVTVLVFAAILLWGDIRHG
jgi:hypothetical protein